MYNDPKRYDHDELYEDEALDSEDEFESDDYDYIVDDEDEDENALWDDEEDTDEPPRKKRKKKAVFSDSDTDSDDTELDEYAGQHGSFRRQCADIPYCPVRQADHCMGFPFPASWNTDDVQLYAD